MAKKLSGNDWSQILFGTKKSKAKLAEEAQVNKTKNLLFGTDNSSRQTTKPAGGSLPTRQTAKPAVESQPSQRDSMRYDKAYRETGAIPNKKMR